MERRALFEKNRQLSGEGSGDATFWTRFLRVHCFYVNPCFSEIIVLCYLHIKTKLLLADGMCTTYLTHQKLLNRSAKERLFK